MAEQILDWLGRQLTNGLKRSKSESEERTTISLTAKERIEAFLKVYSDETAVMNRFVPMNWDIYVGNPQECIVKPCIFMREVDKVYKRKGLAKKILRNNFAGVYSMNPTRDGFPEEGVNLAAAQMVAKYGGEMTLYSMMAFFGNYSEYRESLRFDPMDIVNQYYKKFLPWWRSLLSHTEPEKPAPTGRPTGIEGLRAYLRRAVRDGDDLRQGGLYMLKVITDKDIRQAEEEVRQGIF